MFKKINFSAISLLASTILIAETPPAAPSTNVANQFPEPVIVKTYKAPNGTEAPSDWNSSHYDMKLYLEKINGSTETSSKGVQLMKDLGVTDSVLLNPTRSFVENKAIKANPDFKDIKSMTSFDQYNQQIQTAAMSNKTLALNNEAGQIKCYITRDIGFAYVCDKTGLVYGGQINDDGTTAKNQCLSECYEGFDCIAVQNSTLMATNQELVPTKIVNNFLPTELKKSNSFIVDSTRKTTALSFEVTRENPFQLVDKNTFYVDVFYKKIGETSYRQLAKRLFFNNKNTTITLSLIENIDSIKLDTYTDVSNLNAVSILSVKTMHSDESKWICKGSQDISHVTPSAFSYICPKGIVTTLQLFGGNTVKVCKNDVSGGDNPDGSYSNKNTCNTICRKAYTCSPTFGSFSADKLQSYREGCIGTEGNCKDDPDGSGDLTDTGDCKMARLNKYQIISEDVFDANMNRISTVKDSSVIPGISRPKIMDVDDADYIKKNKEEWKDEAYADMQQNGTYNITSLNLGENTIASSAYGIGMSSGVDGGTLDPTQRTLYWKLKTKSEDALTNTNLFFYSILEIDVDYYGYNQDGKIETKRDRLWYIKTSNADTFKPIKRAVEYATVTIGPKGLPDETLNAYSTASYQTFSGNNWVSISENQTAEAFKTGKISVLSPYEMIPVISNMSILNQSTPGVVRRVETNGPISTKYYTGEFGKGRQAIAKYAVYSTYGTTSKSYKELMNSISDGSLKPIYNSQYVPHFSKEVENDGQKSLSKEVEIYKFGKIDKLSAYMRIRPKAEDVGRQGFIFVFAY